MFGVTLQNQTLHVCAYIHIYIYIYIYIIIYKINNCYTSNIYTLHTWYIYDLHSMKHNLQHNIMLYIAVHYV